MNGLIAWALNDTSDDDLRALPATRKIEIIKAMGFSPQGADHSAECPYSIDAGYVCNCNGEPISFSPPKDVQEALGDTWEQRLEKNKTRDRSIPEVERW